MPRPKSDQKLERLLLCDGEATSFPPAPASARAPARCAAAASGGLDWPLSRDEMKGRVLQLYDKDVRAADKVIRQNEQALGTSESHVDQLSRSLRKIISEASEALEDLELTRSSGISSDAKGKQQRARAKSQDPRGKVPREPSSKVVKSSRTPSGRGSYGGASDAEGGCAGSAKRAPSLRVSLGSEPEKEPGECASMPMPVLPPPPPTQYSVHQMQGFGHVPDQEETGTAGTMKKICEGMSGKLRDSVHSVMTDVVEPPNVHHHHSSKNADGPPEDFVTFMQELLTPSILWPSDMGAHFIKTE